MIEIIATCAIVLGIVFGGRWLIENHKTNANETARAERLRKFYKEMAKKYPVKGE